MNNHQKKILSLTPRKERIFFLKKIYQNFPFSLHNPNIICNFAPLTLGTFKSLKLRASKKKDIYR